MPWPDTPTAIRALRRRPPARFFTYKRALTNLYNARPIWLELAHKELDAAVFAAYGWPETLRDEQILEKLLALNLERAGRQ